MLAAALLAAAAATAAEESWFTKLLRVAGITASPARLRGAPDDVLVGDIWVVGVNGKAPRRLATGGHFRSPVFSSSDDSVLALRDDVLVRIPPGGGKPENLLTVPHAVKLIGFDENNADQLLVLLDGSAPIGAVSISSRSVNVVPEDPAADGAADVLAQVRGQDRNYGRSALLVRTQSRRSSQDRIEWTEIYFQQGNGPPQQVTACNGASCGQPAMSSKGTLIAYIQEAQGADQVK